MDELFRAFKGDCRMETQKVYAKLLHAAAKRVAELKKEQVRRRALGEEISS
jgi:hypothetical protein